MADLRTYASAPAHWHIEGTKRYGRDAGELDEATFTRESLVESYGQGLTGNVVTWRCDNPRCSVYIGN